MMFLLVFRMVQASTEAVELQLNPRFVYSEDLLLNICVICLVWDRLLLYKGGSVHNDFDDSTMI